MEGNYPHYTVTDKMLNFASSIMKRIGKTNYFENLNQYPELRRKTRINSKSTRFNERWNLIQYRSAKRQRNYLNRRLY